MTCPSLTRRAFAAACAALALPRFAAAREAVIDLTWPDLVPEGEGTLMETLRGLSGVVEHGQLSTPFEQPEAAAVTREYDGKLVRLPGYVVPLDYDGTGVTTFILVPYVGACIHVPPPPANQLVLVTTDRPYEDPDLFEAVSVTGMFGASATGTALAEIGYALEAERVEPYGR
jgi:hypothetical protein